MSSRRVRVLLSFPTPGPRSNPFTALLHDSVGRRVDVAYFSWREALIGSWDVLHLHWPEVTMRGGGSKLRRPLRQLLFALLLVRIRMTGRGLVRTLHNVKPHEDGNRIERTLFALCDSWTTHRVRLTGETPVPAGAAVTTIPHGHYRDVYEAQPAEHRRAGRILYFGLVRPYKGIEELIDLLGTDPIAELELRIVGFAADAQLGARITAKSAADPRITSTLRYVSAEELTAEIGEANLVVLPYREMHNSGSTLLALSMNRPVLVPANTVTEELAAEVGRQWVHTFQAPLTLPVLDSALRAAAGAVGEPDLTARDWATIAAAHETVYYASVSPRRRRALRNITDEERQPVAPSVSRTGSPS